MRILDDYEARTREEDAKIADFRHLASRAAHLALTNRALATAILTVDTNVQRYGDICSSLDNFALSRTETASRVAAPEPNEEGDEIYEPEEWSGDPNTSVLGALRKGKLAPSAPDFLFRAHHSAARIIRNRPSTKMPKRRAGRAGIESSRKKAVLNH